MKNIFLFLKFAIFALFASIVLVACSILYNPFSDPTYIAPDNLALLYDDDLHAALASVFSGTTVNPASTAFVHAGTNSLKMALSTTWGGFILKPSKTFEINNGSYAYLRFYINGGTASNQDVRVYLRDAGGDQKGGNAVVNNYIVDVNQYPEADTWKEVRIPLSFFAATPFLVQEVAFQDNTGSTFTVYLDDIEFCNIP